MSNSEVILFRHEQFGEIRTLNIDGEPWFVGKDIALSLGYTNPAKALRDHVDSDDVTVNDSFTVNGTQGKLINESGLYSLILSSKLPSAKSFKHWVTAEVLPSIRRNGAYLTAETLHKTMSDPRELAKLLNTLADEREKRQKLEENAFLTVKARYYDQILNSKNSVPVTQIAKDYGMSAVAFNKLLHELRIQFLIRNSWVLYAEYADKNYTQSKTYQIGEDKSVMQAGRLHAAPKARHGRRATMGSIAHLLDAGGAAVLVSVPQGKRNPPHVRTGGLNGEFVQIFDSRSQKYRSRSALERQPL